MNKKDKRISIVGFVFSAFLIFTVVINFFGGHIGAAICGICASFFFFVLSAETYKRGKGNKQ